MTSLIVATFFQNDFYCLIVGLFEFHKVSIAQSIWKCQEPWKWVRKSRKNEEFRENGRTKAIEPLPLTSSVATLLKRVSWFNKPDC